jgi:hypothetical protein
MSANTNQSLDEAAERIRAMFGVTDNEPAACRRSFIRPCLTCGEMFEPTRTDAKFCCAACKQKAHRRALRIMPAPHRAVGKSRNADGAAS